MTVITKENVAGDVPGRLRVLIENLSTQTQRGLLYAIRSRFRGDGTDPMEVEAETLTPLGGAALAALSGASGGGNNVVRHTNLPAASWLAILETKIAASGQQMTHVGAHEVWARIHDPAPAPVVPPTVVKLRLEWFTGDATRPTVNKVVRTRPGAGFTLVNLGEVIPKRARVGRQTWIGRVLAKADAAGADVSIDKLYVLPTGEGYGRIVSPLSLPAPTTFSARDEFNQGGGALTGAALPDASGNWTGAGDADDFAVNATDHVAERTAANDADGITGRYALAPPTLTDTAVEVDVKQGAIHTGNDPWLGVLARYADANNWLQAVILRTSNPGAPGTFAYLFKRAAGTLTVPQAIPVRPTAEADAWDTVRFVALASGEYAMWVYRGELVGDPVFAGRDSALATGGALASGKVGLYDLNTGTNTLLVRQFDNFAAWVPAADAVLYPNRNAELSTGGYMRQSSDGSASSPIVIQGALPRMPVSGQEGRSVEVFLETSRGDLDQLPDSGIDSLAARLLHRPSHLFPPRS